MMDCLLNAFWQKAIVQRYKMNFWLVSMTVRMFMFNMPFACSCAIPGALFVAEQDKMRADASINHFELCKQMRSKVKIGQTQNNDLKWHLENILSCL